MPYSPKLLHPETLAVSPSQAAEIIGLQPPTLEKDRREAHLGIPFVRAGRRIIYRFADLKDWLEEQKQTPIKKGDKNA